jgi:8-oxo-dGTP diphosphatase
MPARDGLRRSSRRAILPPMSTPTIETPRLILRPLTVADADAIERYVGDWDVARWTAAIPHPYPKDAAAEWIRGLGSGSEMVLAIIDRDKGGLIGCMGLEPGDDAGSGEFGYWIGKPFWGRGYGTEALRAYVAYAFRELGLERVAAGAMPANKGSIRVQEKAGFRKTGERDQDAPARAGGMIHVEVRALDRADWERLQAKNEEALPVLLVAAVALIDADGRILLAQRPPGKPMAGLWEFPGGKVHDGETPEAALIRELKEELAIDVTAACLAPFTFASHRYDGFHLLMPLYVCRRWEGIVTALEGQSLAWVRPPKLADYPMPPADRPLVAMIRDFL